MAGRIATEMIIEFRYKLRMTGVPFHGPSAMLGDNASMVLSASTPSSTLKKKHSAIVYHRVCEAIAAGVWKLAHVNSKEKLC